MAKQIKPEEEVTTTQEVQPVVAETTITTTTQETKPEAYVLSVLQAFPTYEQLYVDKHGGIYTSDTPENLRGMATLYKNPYFIKP